MIKKFYAQWLLFPAALVQAAVNPLPIKDLPPEAPVDFERQIRPFLSDNCFACHSQTTSKGGLNMETPELMLKGGENGPAVVAQKPDESLLLQAAAHRDEDMVMPPPENKAKARNLTPEQLGLLKRWIELGAKGSPKTERTVQWQPAPITLQAIFAVAVTADGQYAACARGNIISIYHVPTGRCVATHAGHRDQINSLAFHPDGTVLASGAYREVKLWRRASPTPRATADIALAAAESAWSAEGSESGEARFWPQANPAAIMKVAHGAPITATAVRGDGQRVATAGGNHVKLWNGEGKLIAVLRGDRVARENAEACERSLQVATSTVAFQKEAAQTISKQRETAQARVKKAQEAVATRTKEWETRLSALSQAMDAAQRAAQAVTEAENDVRQVNESPAPAPELAKAETERREALRKKAVADAEAAMQAQQAAEAAKAAAETAVSVAKTEADLAQAEDEQTSRGVTAAAAEVATAEARRVDAELKLQAAKEAAAQSERPIRALSFSPDGKLLFSAGDHRTICSWGAEDGAPGEVLRGLESPITSLGFTAAGELVSTDEAGLRLVWSLETPWTLDRTLGSENGPSPFTDRINALAFSPDGKLLATGSGEPSRSGEIKLWAWSDLTLVRDLPTVHSDSVLSLEFSPDGKRLASGGADKMARIIELESGRVARTLEGHTHHVLGVAWSLDGRTLATAGADNVVKVWDPANGTRKKNLEGYEKEVTAVKFAGASVMVVTSSGDNRVRLVGVDGKEVRAFPEVSDFMQALAVTADGKTVVAGGQDGVLRVWNAADGRKRAAFPPTTSGS